jgi:hypothetical protein
MAKAPKMSSKKTPMVERLMGMTGCLSLVACYF